MVGDPRRENKFDRGIGERGQERGDEEGRGGELGGRFVAGGGVEGELKLEGGGKGLVFLKGVKWAKK